MNKDIFGMRVKYIFKKLHVDLDGEYCHEQGKIYISSNLQGEALILALIHEEGHAIADRLGLSDIMTEDVEELFIDNFTRWLVENYLIYPK